MKFITGFLALFLFTTAFAATPYPPEINRRFKNLETGVNNLGTTPSSTGATTNGIGYLRVARVSFDSTTQGTSSSTTYSLGATLPANALIWDGVVFTTSGFTNVGTAGSVAIECEDSKNIMADKSTGTLGATGTKTALTPVGTAATAVSSIAAACAISARVSNANVVGKFDAWIEYFVTD